MSSILTNTSAMVALQTLKSINSNLAKTQDEISTGKSVASAKDNAAVWAISKVMETDVEGFKALSSSLSLCEQTVAVARNGAETVVKNLQAMRNEIIKAQGDNYSPAEAQKQINGLKEAIASVVSTSQLNGLNLLSNTEKTAGTGTVNVLSSLDRSATGVAAANIAVGKEDLGIRASNITGAAVATGTNGLSGAADATVQVLTGAATAPATNLVIDATSDIVAAGTGYSVAITAGAGSFLTGFNTADVNQISYVARDGDTEADVAKGLADSFNKYVTKFAEANPTLPGLTGVAATVSGSTITFTGSTNIGSNFSVTGNSYAATGNTIGGGLAELSKIDVTTAAGAKSALTEIEGLLKTATAAAANFGSAQGRIETQSKFISGLTDSLKAGIGTLVDANMEEASARLQALQVQQQLGVQALSIANQAPQSIMSLFR